MPSQENPFVFGEIIDDANFVNRTDELNQLVRDLADGQKVFLLSPRRFGKSSLVALALLKLKKRHIHTGEIGSESQVLRRREVIWQAHPRVSAGHFVPDQIRKYG